MEFPEEMKANLEKLRALSKDDLSENGLLRSRIDQQCELICILKQRADESLKKCMTLEEENSELKKHRDEILTALHNETRKFAVMEKRFFWLAAEWVLPIYKWLPMLTKPIFLNRIPQII